MKALGSLLPDPSASMQRPAPAALARLDASVSLQRPPSPQLAESLEICRGALIRVEQVNPLGSDAPAIVTYRRRSLGALSPSVRSEAVARLAACDAMLKPANLDLRNRWALMFAAAVEKRFPVEAEEAEVATLAGLLDLPPIAFLEDLDREPGETSESYQFRRMVGRVRYAARACRGWWASYGKLEPIMSTFTRPLIDQRRELQNLLARLEDAAPSPPSVPQAPPSPDAYLDQLELQPADRWRAAQLRAFVHRLSPENRDRLSDRIARLSEAACEPQVVPRVVSLSPNGSMATALAAQNAERHAQTRAQLAALPDHALAKLQAEKADLVDLTDRETK